MKPLVSILIPAFNAQKWIASTIRSALAQTWPRTEIIIVDDGSTDETAVIARQFESDKVRVFSQPNQGAAAARNKAFLLSRGEYIQWLDADDMLSEDKIAKQMEVLEQCPGKRTLASCAWGQFLFRSSHTRFIPSPLWCDLSPVDFLVRKMGQNQHMQTATWLVSRELTEAAGPWDCSLLGDDDGEYFCRVLLASDGIRFVPDARVYYRASGASSLSYLGTSDRKLVAHWRSMQLHMKYVRSLEESPRVRACCVQYLQNWLIFFYPDRLDLVKKMTQAAEELGGQLRVPRLSWKYVWIQTMFGWNLAHRARVFLPRIRWAAARFWDKMLLHMEGGNSEMSLR